MVLLCICWQDQIWEVSQHISVKSLRFAFLLRYVLSSWVDPIDWMLCSSILCWDWCCRQDLHVYWSFLLCACHSRIGSNDDIYTNKSTFFLEMIETANILNTGMRTHLSVISLATNKSLVLVDEIGRGTGAQEGLSLSLSVLFYIYSHLKCRCIFATHFHELPTLLKVCPERVSRIL